MKKLILMSVAVIFMAASSFAQDSETDFREKLLFGFKVGANYSNVYDEQGEEFRANPKLGFATGAFLAIPFGKYVGIQPEVLFSQRGYQGSGTLLFNSYNYTRTTSHLDIPLLFAVKPSQFLTILAGPQYSYLLHQKDVFRNGTITSEQEQEFKNNNIRRNTLSFTGGIDITLRHLVLGARAGWDIQRNDGDGTSTNPRYKNVWYQATIGYRFL